MRTGGSRATPRAAWHSAMHIVGTPSRIVVPVRVMVASVCSASNRRTTEIAPPTSSVETIPVDWPRTCENGAAPSITSSGPRANASAAFRAAARTPPWVRIAPFGRPDVPEVNSTTAGSRQIPRDDLARRGRPSRGSSSSTKRHRRRCRDPLLDLGRSEESIERNDDRPEPEGAEVGGDEVGRVRKPDRDAVAGADTPVASAPPLRPTAARAPRTRSNAPRTTTPGGRRARPHRLPGCGRGSSEEESQVT